MSEQERIKMFIANCRICTLADAMKNCPICKFNAGLKEKEIKDVTPNQVHQ